MKYYTRNATLLHEWAHGLEQEGSNRPGTLSFDGRVLYSGSSEIAIITRAGVLFEKEPYYTLEKHHVRLAEDATLHLPVLRMRRVDVLARCMGRGVRYFEREYEPHVRTYDLYTVLSYYQDRIPILAAVIGATTGATRRALERLRKKAEEAVIAEKKRELARATSELRRAMGGLPGVRKVRADVARALESQISGTHGATVPDYYRADERSLIQQAVVAYNASTLINLAPRPEDEYTRAYHTPDACRDVISRMKFVQTTITDLTGVRCREVTRAHAALNRAKKALKRVQRAWKEARDTELAKARAKAIAGSAAIIKQVQQATRIRGGVARLLTPIALARYDIGYNWRAVCEEVCYLARLSDEDAGVVRLAIARLLDYRQGLWNEIRSAEQEIECLATFARAVADDPDAADGHMSVLFAPYWRYEYGSTGIEAAQYTLHKLRRYRALAECYYLSRAVKDTIDRLIEDARDRLMGAAASEWARQSMGLEAAWKERLRTMRWPSWDAWARDYAAGDTDAIAATRYFYRQGRYAVRVDGDGVVTSGCARVPLKQAIAAAKLASKARKQLRKIKIPNGVGGYSPAEALPDGSLRIGCHLIPWVAIRAAMQTLTQTHQYCII